MSKILRKLELRLGLVQVEVGLLGFNISESIMLWEHRVHRHNKTSSIALRIDNIRNGEERGVFDDHRW